MKSIITRTAGELPIKPLVRKNIGTPIAAAALKHISWRFVSPSATLVFTLDKSFGTGTYAI